MTRFQVSISLTASHVHRSCSIGFRTTSDISDVIRNSNSMSMRLLTLSKKRSSSCHCCCRRHHVNLDEPVPSSIVNTTHFKQPLCTLYISSLGHFFCSGFGLLFSFFTSSIHHSTILNREVPPHSSLFTCHHPTPHTVIAAATLRRIEWLISLPLETTQTHSLSSPTPLSMQQ